MLLIDMFSAGIKAKNTGKAARAVLLMILPVAYGIFTLMLLSAQAPALPRWLHFVLFSLIPNIMLVEGSLLWVLFGALFYVLRKKQILQIIPPVVFGVIFLMLGSIEWLIIFAAIPILLYNRSRGKGGKYFFYIFYPAHIYVFYIAAYFLQK